MLNFQHDDSRIRTAAEVAAGVMPVNYAWPPGYVDRYGTNTTRGTTDMVPAFDAAFAVASRAGCPVRWGATAPYRLNSPVNCTSMYGVVAYDESSSDASTGVTSIIIAHDGQTYSHGFDLSGSAEMTFHDVTATNLAGKVPNSVFFCARNAAQSGAGQNQFINFRTPQACTFRHLLYWYGSEENVIDRSGLYNSQPGSSCVNINASNPSGYTSSFITIASGVVSNVTFFISRTDMFNEGNSGLANEVCVLLERAGNFSWVQGSAHCPHGLAYVEITGTRGINFFTLDSIRGETDGVGTPACGIAVRTTAATGVDVHAHWKIQQFTFDTAGSGYLLDCSSTSDIFDLTTRNCHSTSGNLLNVHSLSQSFIEHTAQAVTGQVGGTVQNCYFVGLKANIALNGTDTSNGGWDTQNGRAWQTGDSYSATSTACTGAITTAIVWTLVLKGREVTVVLPAISATATAATSFTAGAAIPVQYRPPTDRRIACMVQDNGAAQVGVAIVAAATGVITVYKNPSSTGNFTAAAGAGLPSSVELSWNL